MNSSTFLGLAFVIVGAVLIYSAFQTPPDPRNVVAAAFGAKLPSASATTASGAGPNPRGTRG